MKKIFALFFALSFLVFAGEKYGVYDLQGNRDFTFDAEPYELSEKIKQLKAKEPNKSLYVSSLKKGKNSKPLTRYRYKTEIGAYIEISREDVFSICPEKEIQGTWISEHSVSLNVENCLSVKAPNLAGTFRIFFIENSGRMDTIQILVDQSYIQMGDYLHRIWVPDSMPEYCRKTLCWFTAYGHYENRIYSQSLIVDKTKFTIGDAKHYSKAYNIKLDEWNLEEYPKNEKLEMSKFPLIRHPLMGAPDWRFANERSKKEGLDTAYHLITSDSKNEFIILENYGKGNFLAVDTSASGYKLPSNEEWLFLMRAGAPTRYYWGDEEDSLTVSRYAWIRPIGLKQVAKLLPNRFGLYDMVGLTDYELVELRNNYAFGDWNEILYQGRRILYEGRDHNQFGTSCNHWDSYRRDLSPECEFILNIRPVKQIMAMPSTVQTCVSEPISENEWKEKCVNFNKPVLQTVEAKYMGIRLIRKTPKLHKLEKF